MLIKYGGYRLFKKRESLVPYSHFSFLSWQLLFPHLFSVLGPYLLNIYLYYKIYIFKYPFFHLRRMEGVYSERSVEGVILGYWRVVRLLGDRIREVFTAFSSPQHSRTDHLTALQQSKLRNESDGNLGLCPLGRFFFPLRWKRAKMCGRKNSKGREDFVHQAGQSATPKQLEVLAHLLGVHIIWTLFLFH